jgi:hypothetical protein
MGDCSGLPARLVERRLISYCAYTHVQYQEQILRSDHFQAVTGILPSLMSFICLLKKGSAILFYWFKDSSISGVGSAPRCGGAFPCELPSIYGGIYTMKPCDLSAAVFVQGWLMILARIQRSLTDDAIDTAINTTVSLLSSDPRFEVSTSQANEIVGTQVLALTDQSIDPKMSAFAKRCLKALVREAVSEN